jgi:hypothetical protein
LKINQVFWQTFHKERIKKDEAKQENAQTINFIAELLVGIAPLKKSGRFFKGHLIYNVIELLNFRALGVLLAKRRA